METKSQCPMHDATWRLLGQIRRIRQVQKIMGMADQAIKNGRDDILRALGFGDEHIGELKQIAAAGKNSAFPKYVRDNNAATIRFLRKELAAVQGRPCTCPKGASERRCVAVPIADGAAVEKAVDVPGVG